jgi:hypothetical protein
VGLLAGVTVHRDRKTPSPLQGVLPLACRPPLDQGQNKRQCAADKYQIEKAVLANIGELTTAHGDDLNARKAFPLRPLTGSQCAWLDAAVKKIILQLGTSETARSLITTSHLPRL